LSHTSSPEYHSCTHPVLSCENREEESTELAHLLTHHAKHSPRASGWPRW
jgi:hypothetical protein